MSKLKNLVGLKFNNYTVIERLENNKQKQAIWLCLCICGEKRVNRGSDLQAGRAKSCGCINWKKEKSSYSALHDWIARRLGKATFCSFNPLHIAKRYEWANISGAYLRDINDFVQLCIICHKQYDKIRRGAVYQ